jgi:hypothetical protein
LNIFDQQQTLSMSKKIVQEKPVETPKTFQIKMPWLWLCIAVFGLYFTSINFDFTELDDSIFIKELSYYNEDMTNLVTSFQRGVFNPTNDTYYRPLFLDAMILNYHYNEMDIAGYHWVNLLLHLGCVLLLFRLFRKLGLETLPSFLLTLLFAIHPVLSQAVVWIPGRNDTLMTLFLLPYFIFSLDYAEKGKISSLVWATFFLVCGFFTKETALIAPAAVWLLLIFMKEQKWLDKKMLIQYATWIGGAVIYFVVRSHATLQHNKLNPSQIFHDFFRRLPLLVQYVGKILLPFNLNVFPILEDTVYYYGIAAIVILAVIIFLNKNKNIKTLLAGLGVFLVFLVPVLLVPNSLNEQTFEHRLYLPIIGMLLVLSQTVLFKNNWKPMQLTAVVVGICALFAVINFRHQQNFKDPFTFWSSAAENSPHSAYALMMYAARIKDDKPKQYEYVHKAYALNPNEKYLNYYYGLMMQEKDSMKEAEQHFLKEQKISDYYECDFYLARCDFDKKDFVTAAKHLERYLTRDSLNPQANNNLMLLYITELKQKQKALEQINRMKFRGMPLPAGVEQQVLAMP